MCVSVHVCSEGVHVCVWVCVYGCVLYMCVGEGVGMCVWVVSVHVCANELHFWCTNDRTFDLRVQTIST